MRLTQQERERVDRIRKYAALSSGLGSADAGFLVMLVDRLAQEPGVVRCGECKHGSPVPADKQRFVTSDKVLACACCRGDYDIRSDLSLTWDDGFCDDGERKEGEHEAD